MKQGIRQGVELVETEQVLAMMAKKIPQENISKDELMKNHTSFKIGGPADLFVCPTTMDELAYALWICREYDVPYYVIGNGSNLLVSDKGIRGVVIQIYKNLSKIQVNDQVILAESGALLSQIAVTALNHGLGGFEFAHGIPGTLGGALVMNAGAYGGEMKDVTKSVEVLSEDGQFITLNKNDLDFGYRHSSIQVNNYVVVRAALELSFKNPDEIADVMKELAARRREKQPLEFPSAGSAFKRPKGYYAGQLIMESGLRGFQIGDARVSDKHCGFIINTGNASAKDVLALIEHIQNEVYKRFNVMLEPEIKLVGEI